MNDFVINSTTAGIQRDPAVAALGTGHYFVVWSDSSDASIKGRLYLTNGQPATEEFVVSEPAPAPPDVLRERPAIAATPLSGAFVTWVESPATVPGPRPHIKMRRYGTDGRPIGDATQVSTTDADPGQGPAVTHMIDAGFLITWADAAPRRRILARRYGFDGAPEGAEFAVSTTEGFHTTPFTARLDGNVVIGWRADPHPVAGGALTLRVLTFDGAAVTPETTPNLSGYAGGGAAVTALDTEQFVLAHVRVAPDGSRSSVETSVFAKDGALAEPGVPACSGAGLSCADPALAPLADDRFLAAWVQRSAATGTGHTVLAKIISITGGSLAEPIRLSGDTPGERFEVAAATVAGAPEGPSAFVVWTDLSGAGEAATTAVRGRMLRIQGEGTLA
ncbi:hypothetical protein [Streptomyces sp. MP131-18]|uniref:hypothetical protein n=1 Tax=Streptomyces sp. MP131-18 TaxID=1857892 RepID=UPI00097C1E06|nr:hypothetical protein [Streptomyces sp. MP131-18]ONK15952.1 hypothetical protein STBA_67950 [Streptomyces sp. MP131-18]